MREGMNDEGMHGEEGGRVTQKWREEGGGKAGEEREARIHVGGNRGIYSSSHTHTEREREMGERGQRERA